MPNTDARSIVVSRDGRLQFVYDDSLIGLCTEGRHKIRRASHVEASHGGGWTADMSPVGGRLCGPFLLRSEALSFENKFLEARLGTLYLFEVRRSDGTHQVSTR